MIYCSVISEDNLALALTIVHYNANITVIKPSGTIVLLFFVDLKSRDWDIFWHAVWRTVLKVILYTRFFFFVFFLSSWSKKHSLSFLHLVCSAFYSLDIWQNKILAAAERDLESRFCVCLSVCQSVCLLLSSRTCCSMPCTDARAYTRLLTH